LAACVLGITIVQVCSIHPSIPYIGMHHVTWRQLSDDFSPTNPLLLRWLNLNQTLYWKQALYFYFFIKKKNGFVPKEK
jgi:hypothetical protein